MNTQKIRNGLFYLHRYLGLVVGVIAIVIGITGSILVFYQEIDGYILSSEYSSLSYGRVMNFSKAVSKVWVLA